MATNPTDPAGGYMAGLGSFARDQGVYQVENAQAQAINLETMIRWNKELRARQQQLQQQKQKEKAQLEAARNARVAQMELADGTTLNNLLMQILAFDPGATMSTLARAPLGAAAIREIPFEWNTEAITVCINQLTARDALPDALNGDRFAAERGALGAAVEAALKEDATGDVSPATMKRLNDAITALRSKFRKLVPASDPSIDDCEAYFATLASLTRLLHDPSMKKMLAQLDGNRESSVGDLIAFMQTYNLRFGPATTSRQLQIYQGLVPLLTQVKEGVNPGPLATSPPPPAPGVTDSGGKGLQSAAKEAFGGMPWPHLEAQGRQP
jgi:hypothetical protein